MSYIYDVERHAIFTEDGQVMFLQIRDTTKRLLAEAGAARMLAALTTERDAARKVAERTR